MPKQTKSKPSMHRQGPAPKLLSYCDIPGCTSVFKKATDLCRHKWRHLPDHLYPTCPFVGPFGDRCEKQYKGRAWDIKIHYEKEHGPYPANVEFPTLDKILRTNNITLGGNSSPAVPVHTTPPASSSNQGAGPQSIQEGHSLGAMQPHMGLYPDQYHFATAQQYYFMPQESAQPLFNNRYPEHATKPIYPSSDSGVQMAMWEHPPYNNASTTPESAPIPVYSAQGYGGHHEVYQGHPAAGQYQDVPPFNHQVENEGWDLMLGDVPSACGDPECNPFEPYPTLEPDIYTCFP